MDSRQVINCTVSTVSGVESSSVMISWMGPGGSITTTNGRVSIGSVTDDGNNMYTRSLQFTYLMEGDEGTYTCNVMILDASGSQSVELQSLTSKLLNFSYMYVSQNSNSHQIIMFHNYNTKIAIITYYLQLHNIKDDIHTYTVYSQKFLSVRDFKNQLHLYISKIIFLKNYVLLISMPTYNL